MEPYTNDAPCSRKDCQICGEWSEEDRVWDSIMRKLTYADSRDTTAILTDDEARFILAKIKDN